MERASSSLGPSDGGSSSSLSGTISAPRPQRCTLESLPAELIEKIFFHSLEINLPRASWHIARILSKPIIYKWLVRVAFSSSNTSSKHDFFTPDFLPPPLTYWAVSPSERTHLQTTILECRWCTLQLIRQCQQDYVKQIIRQKCKDLVFSDRDQQILDNIDQWFSRPMEFDLAVHGRRGSGDLVMKAKKKHTPAAPATTATSTAAETTPTAAPVTTFSDVRISFWIHFGAVQIGEPSPVSYEIDQFRLPCAPSLDERPRMPNKLLRPPWTAEKLEFLLLLSQEAWIDEDTHSSDRSHLVLRQLIRDRDYLTFEKLLYMNVVSKNYSYPQNWPVKTRHFRAAVKYARGRNDPFVRLLYHQRWHVLGERERDVKAEVLNNLDVSARRLNFE
ncbi:hypothetical protein UA08_01351 [Talaromyces atroroseus]|uniref:Uncharacterized protein n=1 Tax=Talaromyces atroroseus TaxID=1441469 RepID=A0A1Q5QBF3_TALAT|nr:hypothetical protein UA08_01351 [Talaromyces atroroseus]OKL63148.1 hypothetical protein UA08_01351 [Talaromyces atroroseus]